MSVERRNAGVQSLLHVVVRITMDQSASVSVYTKQHSLFPLEVGRCLRGRPQNYKINKKRSYSFVMNTKTVTLKPSPNPNHT